MQKNASKMWHQAKERQQMELECVPHENCIFSIQAVFASVLVILLTLWSYRPYMGIPKEATHPFNLYPSHCSRITCYRSFISQDFFHFSSFIHNRDNLNLWKKLNFHGELLKNSKFCTYWKFFSEFYVSTYKIVAILRKLGINHWRICKQS